MPRIYAEPFVIYGLFEASTGRCRYIGQTRNPNKRREQHFNPFRGKTLSIADPEFRILRKVADGENPSELENALIREHQSRGEADLNTSKSPFSFRSSSAYYTVLWQERDLLFRGFGEVGRALGCTAQTVQNYFRREGRLVHYDNGITLILKSWPSHFTPIK